MPNENKRKTPISKTRQVYFVRLFFRIVIFIMVLLAVIIKPEIFSVIEQGGFFSQFSPLHLLFALWIFDMFWQLVPVRKYISIGSKKNFRHWFKPIKEKINYKVVRDHVVRTTKSAYLVLLLWGAVILFLGAFYFLGLLKPMHLFLISTFFYVADLICVLIWCPFRLIMKNRCCTTCRIFNWDHLMMFTPMLFLFSMYSTILVGLAFVIWLIWELCVMIYPERFSEITNESLRCSECTDKLCTQYCKKLRD